MTDVNNIKIVRISRRAFISLTLLTMINVLPSLKMKSERVLRDGWFLKKDDMF